MFDRIATLAKDAWAYTQDFGQDLLLPTVRLGVTGLARSGKTVFITALVHNLLAGGRLPFFEPLAQGRIARVFLNPQPDDAVPRFDYEGNLAKLMAKDPEWPQSTRQISQLRLTIEFDADSAFWRTFGTGRMHLDIVDYPGEWLLDLPLLEMNFEEWSRAAMSQARENYREKAAAEWLAFSQSLDLKAARDEQKALQGAEIFTRYLARCREEALSFSSLPPGRFLMPGDLAGSPAVTFMPLDVTPGEIPSRDSLWAMMARRFEAYKTHVIEPFFRNHFVKLDRQIVLVDVLSALNAGSHAVADLSRALTDVLQCFRQGQNGWFSLMTGKRIDRIVFAATKADHLHHSSHDRLEKILRLIVSQSMSRAQLSNVDVEAFALSSLRATREAHAGGGKQAMPCIAGTPLAGERLGARTFNGHEELVIFPGDLPEDASVALSPEWQAGRQAVHFVRFRPPHQPLSQFGQSPILPHIRLDRALNFLLADKLS